MENLGLNQAKVEKPHAYFREPHEVLVDPALSKAQQSDILRTLEQDARQMSVASDEGMAGGEPTNLHDVLETRDSLELPPVAQAYDLVLNDLRARLTAASPGDARTLIELGLTAVEAIVRSPVPHPIVNAIGTGNAGRPDPKAAAEIDDEIEREKLDP